MHWTTRTLPAPCLRAWGLGPDELAPAACTGGRRLLDGERCRPVRAGERGRPAGRHGGRRRALRGRGCAAHRRGGPARGQPGGPAPAHARAAPRGLPVHGVRRPATRSVPARSLLPPLPPARERAGRAQVPQPVRRVGGGPSDAAVLRLQRRALLLGRVPKGGLARGPQGRVPAPASARLTAAACRARPARCCVQADAQRGYAGDRLSRSRSMCASTQEPEDVGSLSPPHRRLQGPSCWPLWGGESRWPWMRPWARCG